MNPIQDISYKIYYCQLVVCLVLLFIWVFQGYKTYLPLLGLIALAMLVEVIFHEKSLVSFQPISTFFYSTLEVGLLGLFYSHQIIRQTRKYLFRVLMITISESLIVLFLDNLKYHIPISSAFSTLCIDYFCLNFLSRLYSTFPHSGNPIKNPVFWITAGNLFFYNFVWIFNNVQQFLPTAAQNNIGPFNGIFNNFLYLTYIIGLLTQVKLYPLSIVAKSKFPVKP